MGRRLFSVLLTFGLIFTGNTVVAAAEPISQTGGNLGWQAAKVVVAAGAPADINITVGATSERAFVAVTGYRSPYSGENFYTHHGTSRSSASCSSGSSGQYTQIVSEDFARVTVSGSGPTTQYTETLSLTAAKCRTGNMRGIIGLFGWGAPGDGYAKNSLGIQLYLPGHPDYENITSSPNVDVLPQIDEDSPYVGSLVAALGLRFAGTQGCLALGEKVRTHSLRSSVPDVTLICNSLGPRAAIRFMMGLDSLEAFNTIYDAVNDPNQDPNSAQPDCDQISSIGTCLEEGMWDPNLPEPSPEPEPAPAGNGIRPPTNCLDPATRGQLEDSMTVQDHHLATHYGNWGTRFQEVVEPYGLTVRDTSRLWNVRSMPHAGGHPWNYHDWVYQNMLLADSAAQRATVPDGTTLEAEKLIRRDIFVDQFTRTVSDVVAEDPTIVRPGYWKCNDEYRWR